MKTKEYFTYRLVTPGDFNRCIIVPKDYDTFPFNTRDGGSYAIAEARVCGLNYPDYLRFLKWAYPDDVIIEGKGKLYPVAYWKYGKPLKDWIEILNGKLHIAMVYKENQEKYQEKINEHSNQK